MARSKSGMKKFTYMSTIIVISVLLLIGQYVHHTSSCCDCRVDNTPHILDAALRDNPGYPILGDPNRDSHQTTSETGISLGSVKANRPRQDDETKEVDSISRQDEQIAPLPIRKEKQWAGGDALRTTWLHRDENAKALSKAKEYADGPFPIACPSRDFTPFTLPPLDKNRHSKIWNNPEYRPVNPHQLTIQALLRSPRYGELLRSTQIQLLRTSHDRDLNIVVPFYGRYEEVELCIFFFLRALDYLETQSDLELRVQIMFVEIGPSPLMTEYFSNHPANKANLDLGKPPILEYLYLPFVAPAFSFPKSLAFNVAFLLMHSSEEQNTHFMFHDLDVLIPRHFLRSLAKHYISPGRIKNYLRPFRKGRINLLDEKSTRIVYDAYENGSDELDKIDLSSLSARKSGENTPGSCLVLRRSTFKQVGGFDPDFFSGWAPEDSFILQKLNSITNGLIPFNEEFEIYHLHHQRADHFVQGYTTSDGVANHYFNLLYSQIEGALNKMRVGEREQFLHLKSDLLALD